MDFEALVGLFSFLLILQTLSQFNQRFAGLNRSFNDLKEHSLRNSILNAKLTRPELGENKIIEASRFAVGAIKTVREIW